MMHACMRTHATTAHLFVGEPVLPLQLLQPVQLSQAAQQPMALGLAEPVLLAAVLLLLRGRGEVPSLLLGSSCRRRGLGRAGMETGRDPHPLTALAAVSWRRCRCRSRPSWLRLVPLGTRGAASSGRSLCGGVAPGWRGAGRWVGALGGARLGRLGRHHRERFGVGCVHLAQQAQHARLQVRDCAIRQTVAVGRS